MTREGTRPTAAFVAAVLAAAFLAACGGSSSTTTGSSSATTAQSGSKEPADQGGSNESPDGGSQGSKGSGDEVEPGGSNGASGSGNVATPLKISGGGSEQFRTKGGDNSIQEFGEEGDESELEAAAEAAHGFFVARAEGDWAGACSYLSKTMTEQLKQLAASSTGLENKGCASFLEAFTSTLSDSAWREITTVDAGSLRREGEQAFLIYYGAPKKTAYAMPLAQEDGEWKVGALAGNALG